LFSWSIALASLPSGQVTAVTAAFPPIVSAIAGVAGVVAIGSLLWGIRAGVLAGLVLTTTPNYFAFAHRHWPTSRPVLCENLIPRLPCPQADPSPRARLTPHAAQAATPAPRRRHRCARVSHPIEVVDAPWVERADARRGSDRARR
jgi:hypothetical protein